MTQAKTLIIFISLILVALWCAPQADAKKADGPSAGQAFRVAKKLAPKAAFLQEAASATPATRRYIVEFYQADVRPGSQAPHNGLDIVVGRNKDLNRNWAIVSYYITDQHLFSRGGLVGDEGNWSLVDPSGNPIAAEDERIVSFAEAAFNLGVNPPPTGYEATASAFGPGLATGAALTRAEETMKGLCALHRFLCEYKIYRRVIQKAFSYSFPSLDWKMMGNNLIDCKYHAVGTGSKTRMHRGYNWLKAYYKSQFAAPMPGPLGYGARKVYRHAACVQ